MTTFAERLKYAMEQANMSQSALSEQAGGVLPRPLSANTFPGRTPPALTVSRPLPMQPAFPLIT